MADTHELLPRLREMRQQCVSSQPDLDEAIYTPVLVPNMKGLDNLLKLETAHAKHDSRRLTNEIAVFVPASDVSRVAPFHVAEKRDPELIRQGVL